MNFIPTSIEGLIILEPRVFGDDRGYFFESYNRKQWVDYMDKPPMFVQDNESMSHKGVLRGLHFQHPPFTQGKLVRVSRGSVLDVAVDLRAKSKTYGEHFKIVLSSENKKQLYVPKGFAHGFLTLEDNTVFNYKCTDYYAQKSESGIMWNDPDLRINWGVNEPLLSEKDQHYANFSNFVTPFK